jgi:hypothetical protein
VQAIEIEIMDIPTIEALLEELATRVPTLTIARLTLLNQMAAALQVEFDCSLNPQSDLATPIFSEYFASRLLIHHAIVEEKLNKKSFEYILRDSLRQDGKQANLTESDVYSGADLTVDGIRVSLKTEASKSIRESKMTISKWMEARWIRDQNPAQLAELASQRFREHLVNYDRILMLRAFDLSNDRVQYDLIEIPHTLLSLASNIKPQDIKPSTGRNGGGTIVIRNHDIEAFTIRLDGSVEKVTIANLRSDLCVRHGTWTIPLMRQP